MSHLYFTDIFKAPCVLMGENKQNNIAYLFKNTKTQPLATKLPYGTLENIANVDTASSFQHFLSQYFTLNKTLFEPPTAQSMPFHDGKRLCFSEIANIKTSILLKNFSSRTHFFRLDHFIKT